jgi:hypothetical protein
MSVPDADQFSLALVRHLEEQQVGELLGVLDGRDAVVAQDVAVAPQLVDQPPCLVTELLVSGRFVVSLLARGTDDPCPGPTACARPGPVADARRHDAVARYRRRESLI